MTDTTLQPTDVRLTFALAVRTGTEVVAGVTPDVLDRPTPCDDMDVRSLTTHLVAVLAWHPRPVGAALAGVDGFLPVTGRLELFERISAEMGFDEVAVPFRDAVPVVDDAPAIDRLVAWNGRDPHWAPPR